MGCVSKWFKKSRGRFTFQELWWSTLIYTTRPFLISHKNFPNSVGVVFVRKEILSSPLHSSCDAVSRFSGFVLTVLRVFEAQYRSASSFIFSELFRSVSRFWSEVSFIDDVCDSTLFLCFSWGVSVFSLVSAVESFWILANLNYPQISPEVAARQHMGLVEYSSVRLRSVSPCSGVKMWHFWLRCWAAAWTQPVILSCESSFWGLFFQGNGLFAALAPT